MQTMMSDLIIGHLGVGDDLRVVDGQEEDIVIRLQGRRVMTDVVDAT
jgi:hypothetical protein